jgi:hypothetical protein
MDENLHGEVALLRLQMTPRCGKYIACGAQKSGAFFIDAALICRRCAAHRAKPPACTFSWTAVIMETLRSR